MGTFWGVLDILEITAGMAIQFLASNDGNYKVYCFPLCIKKTGLRGFDLILWVVVINASGSAGSILEVTSSVYMVLHAGCEKLCYKKNRVLLQY